MLVQLAGDAGEQGSYSAVHVKSLESHQLKALLGGTGDQLVQGSEPPSFTARSVACCGPSGSRSLSGPEPSLSMRLCEWPATRRTYSHIAVGALLDTLANVASQIAVLDKQVRTLAQKRKACWHLMSVPGVGPITALAFTAAIEDPHRCRFEPGCWGLSGPDAQALSIGRTRQYSLSISRQGDEIVRHYLYEAANCLLTTVTGASTLQRVRDRRSSSAAEPNGPAPPWPANSPCCFCGFGSRRAILKPSRHRA